MIQKNNPLVLITGGAGFIGSHLVDAFIAQRYRVRVLDSLLSSVHRGRLPLWFNTKALFIKGDVRKGADLIKALSGVSYIFHLAAYMDQHPDFSTYIDVNTKSLALLYEIIIKKKLKIKKIIIASSQAVYGEGKYSCPKHGVVYPPPRSLKQLKEHKWELYCSCGILLQPLRQTEDDKLYPMNIYGASKTALEDVALSLGKACHIPTVLLRYSIVHGPHQSFKHFYSGALRSFAVQALAGEPIEMHEDAGQLRDFVHIDDVVRAHFVVMRHPKASGEVFNVGNGQPHSVCRLAQLVSKVVGVPFRPVRKGFFRVGTPRHSIMDVSKLKKLGWRPIHPITDNVTDYIRWVRNFPDAIYYLRRTYETLKRTKVIQS